MFRLDEPAKDGATGSSSTVGEATEAPQGWWEYMGKAIVTPAASFLPTQVRDFNTYMLMMNLDTVYYGFLRTILV